MNMTLSSETYEKFQRFIYSSLGLYFPVNKKYLLENSLKTRLLALQCESFEAYFLYLQFNAKRTQEQIELANCLTTNETFFFRDQAQIDCLRVHVLPELLTSCQYRQSLRIWSAGCSTGEEAYTLAILLEEHIPDCRDWRIDIIGTDINEEVLRKARIGLYDDYAIRNIPAPLLKKYFTISDGHYEVCNIIKQRVTFSKVNLFDTSQMRTIRDVDLLLCRNVLIYFDEPGRKQIISGFHHALRANGAFMIGFSETLQQVKNKFRLIPWNRTMVYYKEEMSFA